MIEKEILKALQDHHAKIYKEKIADNSIRYTDAETMLVNKIISIYQSVKNFDLGPTTTINQIRSNFIRLQIEEKIESIIKGE